MDDDSDDVVDRSEALYPDKCRWFTRGWTLQELLAPCDVHFFNARWKFIGNRYLLAGWISDETGISGNVLKRHIWEECGLSTSPTKNCCPGTEMTIRQVLDSLSILTRMNWASARQTTRPEDLAYCLMGIFDVNMPLLYGEGHKAFRRVQEAIVRSSHDQTILAWGSGPGCPASLADATSPGHGGDEWKSIFAAYPGQFESRLALQPDNALDGGIQFAGNRLELEVGLGECLIKRPVESVSDGGTRTLQESRFLHFAVLCAHGVEDPLARVAILLDAVIGAPGTFLRVSSFGLMVFELSDRLDSSYTWSKFADSSSTWSKFADRKDKISSAPDHRFGNSFSRTESNDRKRKTSSARTNRFQEVYTWSDPNDRKEKISSPCLCLMGADNDHVQL